MQLHVPMTGRDPEQTDRAVTPLELFFDLTALIPASSFTPESVLGTGVILAGLIAAAVIARCFEPAEDLSEGRLGQGPFHN
jgi:hypothetical protein